MGSFGKRALKTLVHLTCTRACVNVLVNDTLLLVLSRPERDLVQFDYLCCPQGALHLANMLGHRGLTDAAGL
eukprot:3096812-Amphidinium_carterae.1